MVKLTAFVTLLRSTTIGSSEETKVTAYLPVGKSRKLARRTAIQSLLHQTSVCEFPDELTVHTFRV